MKLVSASRLLSMVGLMSVFVTTVLSACTPLGDCQHGGDCTNDETCVNCNGDWFGLLCQHMNTESCNNDNECRNNGNCNGNRVCECRRHWYGPTCETVCPGSPPLCKNGGTCMLDDGLEGFLCDCVNPYTGKFCEAKKCNSGVCLNGGTPDRTLTGVVCGCPPTHKGPCCQDIPGPTGGCHGNPPCVNGGTCPPNPGPCICPDGWVGPACQDPEPGVFPPDPPGCDSDPCANGGNCSVMLGTNQVVCQCPPEYTGDTCEDPAPVCSATKPCMNGGTCVVATTGDFICNCDPMFTGSICEDPAPTPDGGGTQMGGGGGDGQQQTATIIIVAAAGGGVALIIVVCVLVICCCCRGSGMQTSSSKSKRMTAHQTVEEGRSDTNLPPHRNIYIELEDRKIMEFPRVNLRLLEHIGSGSFAEVYKAKAYSIITPKKTNTVAVKVLKENATDNDRKDFMKELSLCKTLGRHENVVNMLGCCTEGEPVYLIMEYLNKGNLQQHLRNLGREETGRSYSYMNTTHGNHLSPSELLNFGIDIASGMEFIALKKCVHRDLAARNVLLSRNMRCKISDFGLARDVADNSEYEMKSKSRVPVRWMATESLMENMYTTKSDIWSFGIVMWEIITLGSHPYPGMSPRQVMEGVLNGYRLPRPDHCAEEIYSKVEHCWEHDPANRPSFSELKKNLEEFMEIDQGYLQMDNFNQGDYVYLEPDDEAEEEL